MVIIGSAMSGETRSTRLFYLDVLRVAAGFAVVWLHVSSRVVSEIADPSSPDWWTGNLADSLSRWCVAGFALLSGALLLDPGKSESAQTFFCRRLKRIIIPVVAWSGIYLFIRWLDRGQTGFDIVDMILHGSIYYHLWFLFMMLGLYVFTPALRVFIRSASARQVRQVILLSLVLASVHEMVQYYLAYELTVFTLFLPFLGYFLAGYYLRFFEPAKTMTWRHLISVFTACVLAVALVTGACVRWFGIERGLYIYEYLSPPVILMSLSVFLILQKMQYTGIYDRAIVQRLIANLGPATFGIYLAHPLVLRTLQYLVGESELKTLPAVSIPTTVLLAYSLSYLLTAAIRKIPHLRNIV